MKIKLWHAPYNGGWIWFDRKQWKRFDCGWKPQIGSTWKGGPDPKLWWCFFGFCGSILIQSWPWQNNPSKVANAELTRAQLDAEQSRDASRRRVE